MKFYFAPMEGLTGYIYRNAHHTCFDNIDKYFSPFIVPNQTGRLKSKEINDILPENNRGLNLIPQILTNNAGEFIQTAKDLKQLGYQEINLNLGCPSGTVVSKNRGAGFLSNPEKLDAFLEEIYAASILKISVKTRIGKNDPDEFYDLIELFNKYPISELIIHPRTREDYYKNKPNLAIFREALSLSKNPVCYNGDITSVSDYQKLTFEFPWLDTVMIGRGLLTNPGLICEIKNHQKPDKKVWKELHDKIYQDYQKTLSGDRNVLFKMKELWFYMLPMFSNHAKYGKKIKKAERLSDYNQIVSDLFHELEFVREEEKQN
jgi:tRNA-dihydrouridine synthase